MSTKIRKRLAIVRIWRGRTSRERADEYEAYNYETGIKPLLKKALGVQTFREDRENETEFMTIAYWESVEAMSGSLAVTPERFTISSAIRSSSSNSRKEVQILRLLKSHGVTSFSQDEG